MNGRAKAMDFLARREHSRHELLLKLVDRGWPESTALQVVEQLTVDRLLSDERFAESLMRVRRQRGYGPVRIRHELTQKGVSDEIIDQWLDPISREWLADVKAVKEKKFGQGEPKDLKERARQARFLQHRGFTFDQIQQVLNDEHY